MWPGQFSGAEELLRRKVPMRGDSFEVERILM